MPIIPHGWQGADPHTKQTEQSMPALFFGHRDLGCWACSHPDFSPEETTWLLLMTVVQCWAESLFLLPPLRHGSVDCPYADFFCERMSGTWIVGKAIIWPMFPSCLMIRTSRAPPQTPGFSRAESQTMSYLGAALGITDLGLEG